MLTFSYALYLKKDCQRSQYVPQLFSIDKIANLSKPLKIIYQDYIGLDIISENYKSEKRRIFGKAVKNVKEMLKNGDLNIGNMYYNYSQNYDERPRINLSVYGTVIEGDLKRLFIDEIDFYQVIANPIKSTPLAFALHKCYTFFNHLDPAWINVNIDFKRITILLQLDELIISTPFMANTHDVSLTK